MRTRGYALGLAALAATLTACGTNPPVADGGSSRPAEVPAADGTAEHDTAGHEASEGSHSGHEAQEGSHAGHGASEEAHAGHEHGRPIDLTGVSPRPGVSLVAEADGSGGILLDIDVSGLELVPADPPADHRPGQGHVHVAVDGRSVAMIATTDHHLTGLADGGHTVVVTLSSNDHRDYHADGGPIGATAEVEVTGGTPAVQPDARFEVVVEGGTITGGVHRFEVAVGDLVEVTVRSDAADDVHLHVYDLKVPVDAGMPAVLLVEADIPGVFEAELHGAGFKLFELEVS